MDFLSEHAVALLIFALYLAVLIYNAVVGSRSSSSMAGYYVGNRSLGGVAVGISFFATFASTNTYIGLSGKSYSIGLPWLIMAANLVLFTWVSWRFIAPRLRRFAAQHAVLTIPDYLGSRFLVHPEQERAAIKLLSAAVIVFASLLYLIAIFKGAGTLFQAFLGISYHTAIALFLVIVVLYTSVGGYVSVVRTDVVQGVMMLVGAIMVFAFVTHAAGGVTSIRQLANTPDTAPLFELGGTLPVAVLMGISLSGAFKLLADPRQLSRFLGLRDQREVRRGVLVSVLGLTVVLFCLFPIGLYARLLVGDISDTDTLVPLLIVNPAIFPTWAADFLIVALTAAAMSSMDSVLLVAASTLYRHLINPFHHSAHPVRWTRASIAGFATLAAAVALNPPGDIVQITIFSGSLFAVCFLPAVLLGLYWERGTDGAVLASMLAGIAVLVLWLNAGLSSTVHELFPGLTVSLLTYVLMSCWQPPLACRQRGAVATKEDA